MFYVPKIHLNASKHPLVDAKGFSTSSPVNELGFQGVARKVWNALGQHAGGSDSRFRKVPEKKSHKGSISVPNNGSCPRIQMEIRDCGKRFRTFDKQTVPFLEQFVDF